MNTSGVASEGVSEAVGCNSTPAPLQETLNSGEISSDGHHTGNICSAVQIEVSDLGMCGDNDFIDYDDLMSYSASVSIAKSCANIPSVDFCTFTPLLGTRFFCFNPSDFSIVAEEINCYLGCIKSCVNYDFDETNHQWKCNETSDTETTTFNISLYQDSTKNKIFVKFHRLSGSPAVFSSSVQRFSKLTYIQHEVMEVNPSDMSESSIVHSPSIETLQKKRKGVFKALPLPMSIRQKTVSSSEFISYCEIFNIWAQSDVQQCLESILSSMPKMWKDLSIFYKNVEDGTVTSSVELINMFDAINRIYKNLCTIAIQAHYALQNNTDSQHHLSGLTLSSITLTESAEPAAATVAPVAAAAAIVPVAHAPVDYTADEYGSKYDFLDFEDGEQFDGSAGAGDDFNFARNSTAGNHAHRHAVAVDVTLSKHRSLAVNFTSRAEVHGIERVGGAPTASSAAEMYTVNIAAKQSAPVTAPTSGLFHSVLCAASSKCSAAEDKQFADMLSQRSKEELSKVLQLSLACLVSELCPHAESAATDRPFRVCQYLTHVLGGHAEFMSVAREMAPSGANCDSSFEMHNTKAVALLAQQLLVTV